MLSYNLLNNLQNYTGVPPHIRVGGNAGDTMLYNPDTSDAIIHQNSNPTGAGNTNPTDLLYFGPAFFSAFDFFPENTPITYGLNLAYQGSDWLDRIVQQANASINGVSNVNVVGFEIGNEPDLYQQSGYRTDSGWGVDEFATQWQQAAVAIYNQVLKPKGIGTNFFEPAATATTATTNGQPFRINMLTKTNIALDNGIYVAGWNQHDYYYYVGVSTYQITSERLLDLSTTVSQFTEWVSQSAQAYQTSKRYYLREMGSIGPTGLKGISDTFANTLWTFNFFLYAATVQVSSVQIHATTFSYGSPWQPVDSNSDGSSPHVRSSYYAFAALDQIIGATCNIRIASLDVTEPAGYQNHIASYNAYADAKLQTLIALNTRPASSAASKGTVNFVYSLPSWAGQTVYISTLTAAGSDATTNTTWNGISYESSGDGTPRVVDSSTQTMRVGSDGSLTVPVRDSQAVVVNLGSKMGSANNVPNTANCNALASSTSEGNDISPNNSSLSGSGGSAAPTFSTPPTNQPFNAVRIDAMVPGLAAVTLLAVALGSFVIIAA